MPAGHANCNCIKSDMLHTTVGAGAAKREPCACRLPEPGLPEDLGDYQLHQSAWVHSVCWSLWLQLS